MYRHARFLITFLLAFLVLGCSKGQNDGVEFTLEDASGAPAGQVTMLVVPAGVGGIEEIQQRVASGKQIPAWVFTSTTSKVKIKGIPLSGQSLAENISRAQIVNVSGSATPLADDDITAFVEKVIADNGSEEAPNYVVYLFSPSRATWIGTTRIESNRGKLKALFLRSQSGQEFSVASTRVRVAGWEPIAAGSSTSPSRPELSYHGPVHVNGYYRKDGTYVRSHTRSAPGTKSSTSRSSGRGRGRGR